MQGETSTLTWSSTHADCCYIEPDIGSVALSDSVSVSPTTTTTYTITAFGADGNASDQVTINVTGNVEQLPEGSFGEQYEDLVPSDATVESYDSERFSVVTGLVEDISGNAIEGVSVCIKDKLEYGTAKTDANGRFSIPVEGGGTITIDYHKDGLLTSHRQVYVPWNDIAIAETVVMIAEDTKATTFTFDGNPNTIITHQSTAVADESGTRSCTMVFSGDNLVYAVDKNGNDIQELTTITTSATEYTTPESMPAKLPPTSAFTYCSELSVDGVQRVRFDKPVITWVDNFLGFDVGEIVPVGYYDRDRGVWVPSDNGVVVRLLDTNADGMVDALDADGDSQPDDLNNDGTFNDEVAGLTDTQKYPPGSTFWRVAITHFTPWDCNWMGAPLQDAIPPNPDGVSDTDQQQGDKDDNRDCINSFVESRSRIFHEDIPIPGTGMTLHYASNRAEGYKFPITIPASGDTVPTSLKKIIVKVEILGRTFEQILDPLPNQKVEFSWDGLDYLGNIANNKTIARKSLGFIYNAVYYSANEDYIKAFAQAGKSFTGIRARNEITSWMYEELPISNQTILPIVTANGWSLSLHHYFKGYGSTLFKGDGTIKDENIHIINTVITTRSNVSSGPQHVAVDTAGNLYVADNSSHCILKMDTQGNITTVAGIKFYAGYSGDGGLATEARLNRPSGVFVDTTGNLYITDTYNNRIRKVDTKGIITTVAGNGTAGYSGDNGLATEASLNYPSNAVADEMGNIYIADLFNFRIRKVDSSGIITTITGNGNSGGNSGDGGFAKDAFISLPRDVAVDKLGNIYFDSMSRIRKVDTSGIITTVAGGGNVNNGDGSKATEVTISPRGVDVDGVGNIYIADHGYYRVLKVDTSGIISTIAGSGIIGYGGYGDGGPATEARFSGASDVAVDVVGNIYIADYADDRVRKVTFVTPIVANVIDIGDLAFIEETKGGSLGYIFSSTGRHKKTIDLETGIVLRTFGYDQDDHLISITDQFGNQTTIEWDSDGVPTAIVSPDGLRTTLTIDADNNLTRVTYPDDNYYRFEYTPEGLMTAEVEPNGNRFTHTFNGSGRLTDVFDQEGGHWNYTRTVNTNGDITTEMITGEGNLTTYLDHTDSTGTYTSTIIDPTGGETHYSQSADGLTVNQSLSCGKEVTMRYGVDPEYQFKYVKETRESVPSGLEEVTTTQRTYEDTNTDDIPDLITEQVTVNGRVTTTENNTLSAQKTFTSHMGRTATALYDPANLLTKSISIPGLYDTIFEYDAKGRLTSVSADIRKTSFVYNTQGFLDTVTDSEGHITKYTYDQVGRVKSIIQPDNNALGFTYNENGNMTVLTNPSTIDHTFGYNRVNLEDAYQTPLSGSYQYEYDNDRQLTRIAFPSGKVINNIYENGRLKQVQTPEGNIDYTYLCSAHVDAISNGTDTVTYGYNGPLITSETMSGILNQSISYSYNNDFDLATFTYAGKTEGYVYDNDGLLTGVGTYTVTRNTGNGLPEAVTGGALNLSRTFNGYGEVATQVFTIGGQGITSWTLTRDKNGRITEKTETMNGTPAQYVYTYDTMGRLRTVTKDGTLVEEYQYDSNGRRNYEMNALKGISGRTYTYSQEDHLLTTGTSTYQYNADGFLTQKDEGTEVTRYTYSSHGELLAATLPDGRMIEHTHDPLGRRIAKRVNGITKENYLWQGLTQLLAMYDGNNNLLMRFEYADNRMPVAMEKNGVKYYLTYDQVGSLRVVADATGNVVKRIDYDSFGNIVNDTDPSFVLPFGFAGGLHDRDTGLVRFGARDYDTETGRWMAKDPIGFAGGDVNLYGYVLNDPVRFFDPLGLRQPILPGGGPYWHHIRNAFNHCPDYDPSGGNGDDKDFCSDWQDNWERENAVNHQHNPKNNYSYRGKGWYRGSQCVYNKETGKRDDSNEFKGTYDYSSPVFDKDKWWEWPFAMRDHIWLDVLPYWLFGN